MPVKASSKSLADTVVVLDFETTGLSPDMGDRAIEIGAVLIENGRITDRFQQLMNPGIRINSFIQSYTGISNAMVKNAGSCEAVIKEFGEFIGHHNLVAHNASFDKKFLDAEMDRADTRYGGAFACSMLIARRLYQNAPNHKLGTLVKYNNLPTEGVYHRALADAEMTAHLWLRMLDDLDSQFSIQEVPFSLMKKLSRTAKASVGTMLKKQAMVAV
ncbi:DNA polymerase III subunit alpha [Endozoicomonas montiporae]|uniref:DNA-directed DNA polymerase n=2 Tax=Endozoicomonas montiporae TaxID=1027273 RepID=A0A081N2C3_9GAMM|nr:3'-5' exonuclease [Endozoicomonas montiporae]AMO58440.1 DNA polymerase III subunit epsilon [Endozoicomonas montiporae CL-33]KEQ12596.1 DNA polymerase III subunit alpha [Endozoicomonas montiporae]